MFILGLSLSMSVLAVDVDVNALIKNSNHGDIESQITLINYYQEKQDEKKYVILVRKIG